MEQRDERGRWLPGTSPNPGGRPHGRGLKQEVERVLAERPDGVDETRLERIARILVVKAEEGDLRALELILKRLWPEKLQVQGSGDDLVQRILAARDRAQGERRLIDAGERAHGSS